MTTDSFDVRPGQRYALIDVAGRVRYRWQVLSVSDLPDHATRVTLSNVEDPADVLELPAADLADPTRFRLISEVEVPAWTPRSAA